MRFSNRSERTEYPIVHHFKELVRNRQKAGKKVFNMTQGAVALSPHPSVLDFLSGSDFKDFSLHLFGPVQGSEKLREAIVGYRQKAFVTKLDPENIMITAGANHAFVEALAVVADPGDEVMVFEPYFFNQHMNIRLSGCVPVHCVLGDESFQPDMQEVQSKWTSRTRAVVVTNPANPTGTIIRKDLLLELHRFVTSRDAWLIIDESYFHFLYEGTEKEFAPLPLNNLIVVGSFSKSLCLAGWRVGYLIAPHEAIPQLIKAQDASLIQAPAISQEVAFVGLQHIDEHLKNILPRLSERREIIQKRLGSLHGVERIVGKAGTSLFIKIRNCENANALAVRLLEETGVACIPGDFAGPTARSYLRLSFGMLDEGQLVQAMDALCKDKLLRA